MDILATTLQAALPAAPAAAPVPAAPDSRATERFAQIMNATPAGAVQAPATAEVSGVQPDEVVPAADGAPRTIGDRILSGMQSVSNDFQAAWKSIGTTLDSKEPLAMQDMLKLQLDLAQLTVQYALVGQVINRSTQNLDQLVRMQ